MRTKSIASALVSIGFGLVALAGCSSDDAVRSRLWVGEVNNNEALTSDVYNNGSDNTPGTADDFVLEDEVTVVINNDPRPGSSLVSGGPYSFVTIDRYDVAFDAEEQIPGFSNALGWTIEARQSFQGNLTLVPFGLKIEPPLSSLRDAAGQIRATARVTFHAREADSDNTFTFSVDVPVHFANWVDSLN